MDRWMDTRVLRWALKYVRCLSVYGVSLCQHVDKQQPLYVFFLPTTSALFNLFDTRVLRWALKYVRCLSVYSVSLCQHVYNQQTLYVFLPSYDFSTFNPLSYLSPSSSFISLPSSLFQPFKPFFPHLVLFSYSGLLSPLCFCKFHPSSFLSPVMIENTWWQFPSFILHISATRLRADFTVLRSIFVIFNTTLSSLSSWGVL